MKNTQLLIFGAILLFVASGLVFVAKGGWARSKNVVLPIENGASPHTNQSVVLKNSAERNAMIGVGASALLAGEDFFDFGTISMRKGKVSRVFSVRNGGEEPMTIQSVYTSCMCTTAFVVDPTGKKYGPFGMPGHTSPRTQVEVGAGEIVSVEAIFDPAAHGPSGVGLAERSVYLETNSAEKPRVELKFKAIVVR